MKLADQSPCLPLRGMSTFSALITLITTFSGIYGVRITELGVPLVIRNGTGPVTLSCIYEVGGADIGLVVKWFHDENDLIYQWIPPMAPQDVGVIKGWAEYPAEVLGSPNSHSIIRLREVNLAMGGEYTCSVSTIQEEDIRTTRMIVYVPESNGTIYAETYNETHTSLFCDVWGAWPQPVLQIRAEGIEVPAEILCPGYSKKYSDEEGFRVLYRAILKAPETPALLECEIIIPLTDYRRRKSIVYYPPSYLREETAFQRNSAADQTSVETFLALILVKTLGFLLIQKQVVNLH